jgi:glycine dehydrogenase subunit 1
MRYLPNSPAERAAMLEATGHKSVDELFAQIPEDLKLRGRLNLPGPLSEPEILEFYRPVTVDALISRGEFFTAYTPYQAEIAQGTLQAMFEFQTLIAQLTGMEVANASLYDGSTATTEAVLMALRITRRNRVVLARTVHPEYRQVLETYLRHQDASVVEIPYEPSGRVDLRALEQSLKDVAAVVIQSPNFLGAIELVREIAEMVHRAGALLIVTVTEPLSLGIVRPPTEADIVAGEAQSFGVPVAFGGPYVGFLAAKQKFLRQLPGRLIGETRDVDGRRGFVLTLATREQHIRREKATSNICTNQSLCALAAAIYLSLLGKRGLKALAEQNLAKAHYAARQLRAIPETTTPFAAPHFNEFVVKTPADADALLAALREEKIIGGLNLEKFFPELKNHLLVCVTEMVSKTAIDRMADVVRRFSAKAQSSADSTQLNSAPVGRNP